MSFFTLRPRGDDVTVYLPEGRDKLPRKARRSFSADATPPEGESLPPGATAIEMVIEPQETAWPLSF